MKNKFIVSGLLLVTLAAPSLSLGAVRPRLSATTSTIAEREAARAQNLVTRADAEIARRITSLNALSGRINAMQRVSADQKSSLLSTIQGQITDLDNLKEKISADASSTTDLVEDVRSIVTSYRIYVLILPQVAIEAAADRVMTIAKNMSTIGTKLQTRISGLGTASTTLSSLLADFNAKVSDATSQAQAAIAEVQALVPDQGNQTQFQANLSAMKSARSKIQAARNDLVAARQDATQIIRGLGVEMRPASTTTSTATGTNP